jgi:RNA polymerase sigma-70 factor (ECF subfamily)
MPPSLLMEAPQCEILWREHADRLLLYATALAGDQSTAEDALQNVFARLLSTPGTAQIEREASYLFRAVRNETLNALRARRTAQKALLFESEDHDPSDAAEATDFARHVESSLFLLPPEEREAVVLKIWGDFSFPEAAQMLGIPEKTFEHRYYRGLSELKSRCGVRHE